MPYQLNGQFVATKSHRLPHAAGAGTAAGGGAFVTMMLPGDTSAACVAPANPRTIAAKTPADSSNLFISTPPTDGFDCCRSTAPVVSGFCLPFIYSKCGEKNFARGVATAP